MTLDHGSITSYRLRVIRNLFHLCLFPVETVGKILYNIKSTGRKEGRNLQKRKIYIGGLQIRIQGGFI